jgi:hypothetical protein
MRQILKLLSLLSLISCGQTKIDKSKPEFQPQYDYNIFDKTNHLQPLFDKAIFDTLHGFDFCWALLETINVANSNDDDADLSKRFSPGQKALYFIWYLDAQVRNGGFVQFYLNGYGHYIPPIKTGLKLIGDTAMLALVENADKEYLQNREIVDSYLMKDDWGSLYKSPYKFDTYDSIYYSSNEKMMLFIEKYARQHPEDFVKFK